MLKSIEGVRQSLQQQDATLQSVSEDLHAGRFEQCLSTLHDMVLIPRGPRTNTEADPFATKVSHLPPATLLF